MTIDESAVGLFVVTGLLSFIGWMVKRIVSDVKSLEKDHAEFKTHVAERYVEKDDLHRHLNDIKDMIKRVFEKLDKQ